jgi:hypothetical protein
MMCGRADIGHSVFPLPRAEVKGYPMPFKPPWRVPETGDLAYGVNKNNDNHPSAQDRSKFIKTQGRNNKTISTVDEMRVLSGDQGKKGHQDEEALRQSLEQHEKYSSVLVSEAVNSNQDIRRKCKGGLYWATKIASKHVHFVLDGIDMKAVVNKATQGDNADRDEDPERGIAKNRTITGSELRWIYRNQTDEKVQQYVQFWFNGKPCQPPWEKYFTIEFGERLIDEPQITEHDGESLWKPYKEKVKHVSQDEVTQQNLNPAQMTQNRQCPCPCVIL